MTTKKEELVQTHFKGPISSFEREIDEPGNEVGTVVKLKTDILTRFN